MFEYIKGSLVNICEGYIVIDVNGIGYKIYTAVNDPKLNSSLNKDVIIYTYLYVKEDIFDLYGFIDKENISAFKMLISVSGVGPKAALSVLSSVNASEFAVAVACSDIKTLTKAQGIGKKTAQRIILELKDKISKEDYDENILNSPVSSDKDNVAQEALNALIVLGYSSNEASRAVKKVYTDGNSIEDLIKKALKQLSE